MNCELEAEKVAENVSRWQLETIEEEESDSIEGLQNEDGPVAGRKEDMERRLSETRRAPGWMKNMLFVSIIFSFSRLDRQTR